MAIYTVSPPRTPANVKHQLAGELIRIRESAFWCTWGPRLTDGCVLALLDRWSSAGSDRACARPEAADPAVAPCAPDLGGSGPEQIPFHLEMLSARILVVASSIQTPEKALRHLQQLVRRPPSAHAGGVVRMMRLPAG